MQVLNFPTYPFRIKNRENKPYVFDIIRKKFVQIQAEEWVRQHLVWFLIFEKNYPKSLINVEKKILVNGLTKRVDLVIFNKDGSIYLLVECKAPEVKISQQTFDQIARYNLSLNAQLLMVSNGLSHYYCRVDKNAEKYTFLESIPDYIP
ncbi:MAG: type I restriction enzyme HsdR N-terminal domain-containing protein [Bacteroidetes bacterium]|nr:type I restriction enzyme HsdR N-terminal domain-containing protein [Bacteroidota bacterium]MDA1144964.1 type I restriction enzyme HsdR N-terminal domain-containing protein [Bacteroidota bacterium]